jgi:hypothetical protein
MITQESTSALIGFQALWSFRDQNQRDPTEAEILDNCLSRSLKVAGELKKKFKRFHFDPKVAQNVLRANSGFLPCLVSMKR